MGLGIGEIANLSGLLNNKQVLLELDLSLIDEDPEQPRKYFDKAGLAELAATIKARGVKTPISVRPAKKSGRYIINHGARRVRASKLAGKTTIPAFVDNDYNSHDQIVENIHRDNLTPREIAEYINKQLSKGISKTEIAKSIGKSGAYIKQHVTLLDLPDPVADIYNSARCQDITLINDLVTIYKVHPEEVTAWIGDEQQDINRGTVKLFREFLLEQNNAEKPVTDGSTRGLFHPPIDSGPADRSREGKDADHKGSSDEQSSAARTEQRPGDKKPNPAAPEKLKRVIVQTEIYGRSAQLILHRRPSRHGLAWMKYENDDEEFETELNQVKLVAVVEG